MVFFLYKCYYIFFLHFSKKQKEIAWNSAIMALTGSLAIFIFFWMELTGFLDNTIPKTIGDGPFAKRGKILALVIPVLAICYWIISHIIFRKARASKSDGLSERFTFVPTKRDKIICWVTYIVLMSSMLILIGIKVLLGQK